VARRNRHYILTSTAERDFRQAKQWSLSRWGKELTAQYFSDLHDAAEYVAKNAQSFVEKGELTGESGLAISAAREHYIVYVPISKKRIIIVALIRQTRDVPAILKANNYIICRELDKILYLLSEEKIFNLD